MSHGSCRFCQAPLEDTLVDLGMSPLSNAYLEKDMLSPKKEYQAKIRASLDESALPGLIQPYLYTPYLWPEWKLDSGWHTLSLTL